MPRLDALIVARLYYTALDAFGDLEEVAVSARNLAVSLCAAGYFVLVEADFSLHDCLHKFDPPGNPDLPTHRKRQDAALNFQTAHRLHWHSSGTSADTISGGLALLATLDDKGTSLKAPPQKNDQLLVYIMGHGEGGGVVLDDAKYDSVTDTHLDLYTLEKLRVATQPWQRVFVALDCCQAGAAHSAHVGAHYLSLQHGEGNNLPAELSGQSCFLLLTSVVFDQLSWAYAHHGTLLQIAMRDVFLNSDAFGGKHWSTLGSLMAKATSKMIYHCTDPPASAGMHSIGCRLERLGLSWGTTNTGEYILYNPSLTPTTAPCILSPIADLASPLTFSIRDHTKSRHILIVTPSDTYTSLSPALLAACRCNIAEPLSPFRVWSDSTGCYSLHCHATPTSLTFLLVARVVKPKSCVADLALRWQPDVIEYYPFESAQTNRVVVAREFIVNSTHAVHSRLPDVAFDRLGRISQSLGSLFLPRTTKFPLPDAIITIRPRETVMTVCNRAQGQVLSSVPYVMQEMGNCTCKDCDRCRVRRLVILTTSSAQPTDDERVALFYASAALSSQLLPVTFLTRDIPSKSVRFDAIFRNPNEKQFDSVRAEILTALRSFLRRHTPATHAPLCFRHMYVHVGTNATLSLNLETSPWLLWALQSSPVDALRLLGFDSIKEAKHSSFMSIVLRARDATADVRLFSSSEMKSIAQSVVDFARSNWFSSHNEPIQPFIHLSTASQSLHVFFDIPESLEVRARQAIAKNSKSPFFIDNRVVMSAQVVYKGEVEHMRALAEQLAAHARDLAHDTLLDTVEDRARELYRGDFGVRPLHHVLVDAVRFDLLDTVKALALLPFSDTDPARLIDVATHEGESALVVAARHDAIKTVEWLLVNKVVSLTDDAPRVAQAAFDSDAAQTVSLLYKDYPFYFTDFSPLSLTSGFVRHLVQDEKLAVAFWVCERLGLELTDFSVGVLKSVSVKMENAHSWADWHIRLACQYLKKGSSASQAGVKAFEHAKEALSFAFDDHRRLLALRLLADLEKWDTIVECVKPLSHHIYDREIRLLYACARYQIGSGDTAISDLLLLLSADELVVDDSVGQMFAKRCDVLSVLSLVLIGRAVEQRLQLCENVFLNVIHEGLRDDVRQACKEWLTATNGDGMSQLPWLRWTHREQIALAGALSMPAGDREALETEAAEGGYSIADRQRGFELSARLVERQPLSDEEVAVVSALLSGTIRRDLWQETVGYLQVLDLSNVLDGRLPDCLQETTLQVKILNLSNNSLPELPSSLFQSTTQLHRLILDNNLLTLLPPSIGHCSNLVTLSVARNRLETLPESLSQLRYLREINLGGNSLPFHALRVLAHLSESLQLLVMLLEDGALVSDARLWCAESAARARVNLDRLGFDMVNERRCDGLFSGAFGMTIVIGGEGESGKTTFFRGMLRKDFVEKHRKTWYASVSYCDTVVERDEEVSLVEHRTLRTDDASKTTVSELSWENSVVKQRIHYLAQERIEKENCEAESVIEKKEEVPKEEETNARLDSPLAMPLFNHSVSGSDRASTIDPPSEPAALPRITLESRPDVPSSAGDDDAHFVTPCDGYGRLVASARHAVLPRIAFIDLGGQKQFRAVQSIIPFASSLYVVVVDLEKMHSTPNEEMKKLEEWFLLPSAKQARAVMVVGTHASTSGFNFHADASGGDGFRLVESKVSQLLKRNELRWLGSKCMWPVDYRTELFVQEVRAEVLRAVKEVSAQVRASTQVATAIDSVQALAAPGALSLSFEAVKQCVESMQIPVVQYVFEAQRLGAAFVDPRVPEYVFVDVPSLADAVGRVYSCALEGRPDAPSVGPSLDIDVQDLRRTGAWSEALLDWSLLHTDVSDKASLRELFLKCQVLPVVEVLESIQESSTNIRTGYSYAIVLARALYDKRELELDTLVGVASTARNVAVDLCRNGFKVVVIADTPMTLRQPAFDNPALEQNYVNGAIHAKQTGELLWVHDNATRANIRDGFAALATMVPGHLPAPYDELVIYITGHGVENINGSCGVALNETRRIQSIVDVDGVQKGFEGAYTMEQLRDDLGVDREQRWRNTLVVLDSSQIGADFDMSHACTRSRGVGETQMVQTAYLSESFHCLALTPKSPSFCTDFGTVLYAALRRAWLSPGSDGGAFGRTGGEGAAEWATIGCVADRVNVELAAILAEVGIGNDFFQTSALGRLAWCTSTNVGEFVVFNKNYTERNKLAMVPAVPASFTGRAKELRQLEARLKQSGTAAIGNLTVSAAGGVGKSTLAAEYARRNAHEYHWIVWVRGTSATAMVGSYREAVRYIPLKHVDAASAKDEEVVAAMREWLSHEIGWLMVVDGCDVITDEMKTMMPGGVMEGKMIVTTRLRSVDELGALFGGGYALMELGVFDEKEGMEYMRKRLPKRGGEDEELKNIVEKLGGMPLALELAAAYLAVTPHVTVNKYRRRLEADILKALKKRSGGGGLEDRVVATYEPSLARAMEIGGKEMVQKMVGVMGFLEGSGMEVGVLRLLVMGQREEEEADEDVFDVALGALCRLCVVDVNGSVVSMHQLVQGVCRVVAFGDEEEMWSELQRVGRVIQDEVNSDSKVYGDVEWSRRVGVHGMRVMEWACVEVGRRRTRGETEEYGDGVVWLGIRLSAVWRTLGMYKLALCAAENACDCVYDKTSVLAASAFGTLGTVHERQGEYTKAVEVYGQALAIQEETLGKDHSGTGDTLNNMAIVFEVQGDYSRALEYYERALTIREKSLGPDHPSTGTTLNNMAGVFKAQGDYSRALEYYERALTIKDKSVGPDHPSTGTTLNNMANVFKAQGDYSRALEYYERALTIREKSVGPDHPSTGDTLNGMANAFVVQGDYSRALEYYGRALTIYKKSVGADHPSIGNTLNNMAVVCKLLVPTTHPQAY